MKWLWTPFLIPPLQTAQMMPWYYYPLTLGEAEAAAYIGLETEEQENASHATWYSHSFPGSLISVLNVNMGRKLIERKVDLTGEFFISTLLNLYFQCMPNINLCTLSCLCLAQSEVP